ncbi:MAG TPA: DUF4159 domain-containing protein [Bacteroidales bacterium]|nr:DUF4159 domain-containing protein [Bacteroidales bacterium]HPS17118.1 DUF4159 domain-containing protein [Bacteroidales bacterium]
MKKILFIILIFISVSFKPDSPAIKIGLIKYKGGGDWYANPTSLPNLVKFCNENLNTNINETIDNVDVGSSEIFNYPFVHLTGHGNVVFSNEDVINLRNYLIGGGFLHISDNYGIDKYIRREMKKVFPDNDFVELPFTHAIYHQKYSFPNGLPKIHEHDNKAPQGFGIIYEGRLVCFYDYECDLGDGWEDQSVHKDSEATRLKALQMGANIIQYVFTN